MKSTEEREASLAEIKAKAEESLFYFCKYILGLSKLNEEFHEPLCDWIQDEETGRRKMVLWPRGTYKSSISVGFCLWTVIHNPKEMWLVSSSVVDLGRTRIAALREHMETNRMLKALWPAIFWQNPQEQAKDWTENTLTVRRPGGCDEPTFSVGGVDRTVAGHHYTRGLLDDLVTEVNVKSETGIEAPKTYFRALRPVYIAEGVDGKGFGELIDGTRYRDNELYGFLIDEDVGLATNTRGLWADDEKTRTILGDHLTPAMFYELTKTMTAAEVACQYFNNPIDDETAHFKSSDIEPFMYDELPPGQLFTVTVTMDPAKKAKAGADRTAISARLTSSDSHLFYDATWAGRLNLAGRAERLHAFCLDLEKRRLRPTKVGIEDPDGLEIKAFENVCQRTGKYFSVTEIKHRGRTKQSRVFRMQPAAEQHRMHIRRNTDGKEAASELYRFGYGSFDDRADAMAMHEDFDIGTPGWPKQFEHFMSINSIIERANEQNDRKKPRLVVGLGSRPRGKASRPTMTFGA